MKKRIKKDILLVCVFTILITILHGVIIPKSKASYNIEEAQLYVKGRADNLLQKNGNHIGCAIVVYQKDGIEYPAYCIEREKPGVGEVPSYAVTVDGVLSNVLIWRAIMNGYPYKSFSELGVQNEQEAYIATKQAVYILLNNFNIEEYNGIGEAGQRSYNALKQIVSSAKTSNESKITSNLTIASNNDIWQTDSVDKNYISKTFSVNANATMQMYQVRIEENYPEGSKITDVQNNEKNTFNAKDNFKILLPIKGLSNGGNIVLNVESGVFTKPIFYGKSPDSTLQDYALCANHYEDGSGSIKLEYSKNETKIMVLKQDQEEKVPLRGAYFDLYDENKNLLYTNLVSNEEGEIILQDILPGRYYLKETIAPSQYQLYPEYIPLEIGFNEVLTIVVNNKKEEIPEIETIKSKIEVRNQETVVRLPKTGM